MKITAILLLIGCLHVNAKGFTQGISLSLKNVSLDKVFTELHNQTGYAFFYDLKEVRNAKPVTIEVKKKTLEEVLDQCLRDQPLTYAIVSKTVVIKPKPSITPVLQPADNSASTEPPPIDVHGRVVNEDGEPVAGASVRVKGTGKGTTTNNNGEFSMQGISEDAVLVFSGVNIETTEMKVGGKTNLSVSVKNKVTNLGEVIINKGYYTEKQKLSTGDVSVVTGKDIEKQPVANPLAALEGRVPGLSIAQTSGIPGGAFTVQIRGQNSLLNGNDPLYIIDGVPYSSQTMGLINSTLQGNTQLYGYSRTNMAGNPLNYINPADIESISILKDADATSIYGSRGANGVILITTKKGKPGSVKVNANVYFGGGKVTRMLKMMNTRQYLEMRNEAFKNDNETPNSNSDYDLTFWDTTRYTNFQKIVIGNTAHYNDGQISVSGGNENTQYLIGGGYHRETTVFPGATADEKASVHMNINSTSINKKFRINFTSSYVADISNVTPSDITYVSTFAPNSPAIYNSDGTLNWAPVVPGEFGTWSNPFSTLQYDYSGKTNNLLSNAVITYAVLPGLELSSSLGYSHTQTNEIITRPTTSLDPGGHPTSGNSQFNATNNGSWIIEPKLTYSFGLSKGRLTALVGSTFQENTSDRQTLAATGFSSDVLLKDIQASANVTIQSAMDATYRYNAVFGRLNYNWSDKYILNITARRDGSSRFGPGKQFANFTSIGSAWIFSQENFIEKNLRFLSFGKLRASYGTSGNDQVGDYRFLDLYNPSQYPYQNAQGLSPASLFNSDLSWEENKKLEIGISLGFAKDRILTEVNYYLNKSNNQLVTTPLSAVTGFSSIPENLPALVQNTGVEFSLNTINVKSKNFNWASSFNLAIPKNKLVSFPGLVNSSYKDTYIVGKPVSVTKVFVFSGVDPATGVYQFLDSKGNNTFNPSFLTDRNRFINRAPVYYGGFDNSFEFKNLQLDILFQFVKQTGININNFIANVPGFMGNQPVEVLNRWQKTGDNKTYQQFTQDYSTNATDAFYSYYISSDAIYSDASFVRLKNLSFSYNFSESIISRLHLKSCRLYLNGQNLITFTKYLGLDPETQGMRLPPLRVWALGLQISL